MSASKSTLQSLMGKKFLTDYYEKAPHSPQRRRERLNLRMKSLSLDSPEGTAHVRHRPRDYYSTTGARETTPPRHSDSGSINRLCE